jgi:hypothetical protein
MELMPVAANDRRPRTQQLGGRDKNELYELGGNAAIKRPSKNNSRIASNIPR